MLVIKETERELAELIVSQLKKLVADDVENATVHILDFMVENVPDKIADEENDWDNATGCYGVSTIETPFDSEVLLLAIGYYGSMEDISTVTIKKHYEIDWEEVTGEIASEIRYQTSLEIPAITRFLVKYKED